MLLQLGQIIKRFRVKKMFLFPQLLLSFSRSSGIPLLKISTIRNGLNSLVKQLLHSKTIRPVLTTSSTYCHNIKSLTLSKIFLRSQCAKIAYKSQALSEQYLSCGVDFEKSIQRRQDSQLLTKQEIFIIQQATEITVATQSTVLTMPYVCLFN